MEGLRVINPDTLSQYTVENYISLIWTKQYNGVDDFELVVPATTTNLNILKEGQIVTREKDLTTDTQKVTDAGTGTVSLITRCEYSHAMVIEEVLITYQAETGHLLTVRGGGLKNWLKRRIVWDQTILSGRVRNCIHSVVRNNAYTSATAGRSMSIMAYTMPGDTSPEVDLQLRGETLSDWIEAICNEYDYGWQINMESTYYSDTRETTIFYEFVTEDRGEKAGVIFSAEYDNLISASYTKNTGDYKNVVLVGGEGEGSSKITASAGTAEGRGRYEAYVDGSSVSSNGQIITEATYKKMLVEYGKTELKNYDKKKEEFTAEIDGNGIFKLGTDFDLGDIVTVEAFGMSVKCRVAEIVESMDSDGTRTVINLKYYNV